MMPFDFSALQNFFLETAPDLPPDLWWLPPAALVFLLIAAAVDALRSYVPDALIFFGLLFVTAMQGAFVSWPFAALHLAFALCAAVAIWALNQGWRMLFRRDAIGMGDAKFTMLAVSCFGALPMLFAWGAGAILALLWIGCAHLAKRRIRHVHFAPFLFAGLCAALYWIRLA